MIVLIHIIVSAMLFSGLLLNEALLVFIAIALECIFVVSYVNYRREKNRVELLYQIWR
ncbi:MAG: hypothetical protein OEZ58_02815 [Gammaproteobacteria bacterium]|nr:hypothetical protein [Gammaproteobacteria bacterium]MDH5727895.1 hypothetical protein [Gammaproteobacteria bacterium]